MWGLLAHETRKKLSEKREEKKLFWIKKNYKFVKWEQKLWKKQNYSGSKETLFTMEQVDGECDTIFFPKMLEFFPAIEW